MSASIARMLRAALQMKSEAHLRLLQNAVEGMGKCTRPSADIEQWFPEEEPSPRASAKRRFYEQTAAARCFGCKVTTTCLIAALLEESAALTKTQKASGIRGGKAPWVRDKIRLDASVSDGHNTEEAA